jgi:phytochrome-interacting factor 4
MLEPVVTSSSGGSGSSLGKTCSLSTRSHGQKRKEMDVEDSVEQSEVKPCDAAQYLFTFTIKCFSFFNKIS